MLVVLAACESATDSGTAGVGESCFAAIPAVPKGGFQRTDYCTCKCGVTAGGDPSSVECSDCPGGFECCPLFSLGAVAGDYCVRENTCEAGGY